PDQGQDSKDPAKPDQGQDQQDPAKPDQGQKPGKQLPETGEQNSILGFAGFLLTSLGLAGLTYKGRH
ncbi:LPXTG cell wall anchor domain-containing protein, partial [Streptococcus oralis]|uniref:LPXTG cell wall anchor domain-containing protein n=1 Tax=Streptococcus oralis TaxID=1303 RepID=UPI0010098F9B